MVSIRRSPPHASSSCYPSLSVKSVTLLGSIFIIISILAFQFFEISGTDRDRLRRNQVPLLSVPIKSEHTDHQRQLNTDELAETPNDDHNFEGEPVNDEALDQEYNGYSYLENETFHANDEAHSEDDDGSRKVKYIDHEKDNEDVDQDVDLYNEQEGTNVNDAGTALVQDVAIDQTAAISKREIFRARSSAAKQLVIRELKKSNYVPVVRYNHLSRSNSKPKLSLSCDQEDAFADMSIDGDGKIPGRGWIPPNGSALESIELWEKEYQATVQKIRETTVGGDQLREFAKSEVDRLRQIRHQLFCRN